MNRLSMEGKASPEIRAARMRKFSHEIDFCLAAENQWSIDPRMPRSKSHRKSFDDQGIHQGRRQPIDQLSTLPQT